MIFIQNEKHEKAVFSKNDLKKIENYKNNDFHSV